MEFALILVAIVVSFGLGVYLGPKVTAVYTSFSNGRAVKNAQALVTKAEADAAALAAARKLVASQPAPAVAPTGPTGSTSVL